MVLDDVVMADVQEVSRALMRSPLIRSQGRHGHLVTLALDHEPMLRSWFEHYLGWKLIVTHEAVRLAKVPGPSNATVEDAPSKRCSVLYCLLLVCLEDAGSQTVISELSEQVALLTASMDDVETFDAGSTPEKRELLNAIRLLVTHGALVSVKDEASTREEENEYLRGQGDAIYDVDQRAAALLVSAPTAPTRAMHPRALIHRPYPDTIEGAESRLRHALMRRLVDEPVVYFSDLPEEQVKYFRAHRTTLVRQLREFLDVQVEVRAEGVAIVDDEMTDLQFPSDSTERFVALRVAAALASLPEAGPGKAVEQHEVNAIADGVAADLRERNVKVITGRNAVRTSALAVLRKLNLVAETSEGNVRLLPALGRYRAVRPPESAASQVELLDLDLPLSEPPLPDLPVLDLDNGETR